MPPSSAATVVAGVPRRTFQHWLSWGHGDEGREPYRTLALRVETSVERWHATRVIELNATALEADPRTRANVMMWELERRFRDDWAPPERGGVNLQVNIVQERSQAVEELLAAAGRALANDPGALERLVAELGGEVVVGEAVEVPELAAGTEA